ncbi:MAG: hypothetical protein IT299_13365 [Dehalococcoidia bacterium]|nr:hypothetical protein [Dehalococcoidia bacterium]
MADPLEVLDVLALAERAIDLGYQRDAYGRLLGTRDPDPRDRREPRFHLVRTVEGNRWAVSAHLPGEERQALEEALASEPTIATLGELETTPPLISGLVGDLYRGPALLVPARTMAPDLDGATVEVVEDVRTLRTVPQLEWVREASAAARPICVARNAAGEVVAVCHALRSLPGAAAAGVETAEAYRGGGLGTAVVAGWARAVRAGGREPHYGTEWSNAASRGIARHLQLVMWGEEVHSA